MATNTTSNTTKPATTNTNLVLASTTAPAPAAPVVYSYKLPSGPYSARQHAQHLFAWVNSVAGGNHSAVHIVPCNNVVAAIAAGNNNPIPFTRMQPANGPRATLFWALCKGVPQGGKPVSNTLAAYLQWGTTVGSGASKKVPLDLLAALTGGFSPKSNTWGTPYVALHYVAPPAPPAS